MENYGLGFDGNVQADKKIKNGLQKICFISELALLGASLLYDWTAPVATIFGFVTQPILNCTNKSTLEKEYSEAIIASLEDTRAQFKNSASKSKIIKEISERTALDCDLDEAIRRSDEFRQTYSTERDLRMIIEAFEHNFVKQIAQHKTLNNFYSQKKNNQALELLKKTKLIVESNSDKINQILDNTHEINEQQAQLVSISNRIDNSLTKIKSVWNCFIRLLIFSCIIFSGFVFVSVFFGYEYDTSILIHTLVSVIASEIFINELMSNKVSIINQSALVVVQFVCISCILFILVKITSNTLTIELLYALIGVLCGVVLKQFAKYYFSKQ